MQLRKWVLQIQYMQACKLTDFSFYSQILGHVSMAEVDLRWVNDAWEKLVSKLLTDEVYQIFVTMDVTRVIREIILTPYCKTYRQRTQL